MRNPIIITIVCAIIVFTGVIVWWSGNEKYETSKSTITEQAKSEPQNQQTHSQAINDDLKKIKATFTIDWPAKKGNSTKYIVEIQNTSDKQFKGKIRVIPSTSSIMGSWSEDIPSLLPGERKTMFSFAEIKPDTKFSYEIEGSFFKFNQDVMPGLNYEIIRTNSGEGYMTFFVYTPKNDSETLIKICQDMKNKYASNLKIGFQIRFFGHKSVVEMKENFAAYAFTKPLNLSKLTLFNKETGVETVAAENI
ncbi:hypothetical protein [Acetonema longum]|uniref:Uncharacterized protein n=1 Tax=Acetonema longum DSM 6540 TaxID=1009370 RepID=F7NLM4_9FIRM|nr:hypothetical protein [Acetonema longum]EGO63046.1 hypothetical protein ALO_14992 [Acetonema longum DSM 6540]